MASNSNKNAEKNEDFNESSRVHLYGKPFHSLKVEASKDEEVPQLARIYGFAYDGTYYKLTDPLVYAVQGTGKQPFKDDKDGLPAFSKEDTGLESAGWRFASDIRVWQMDKNAASIAIDFESGSLEEILLEPVLESDEEGMMSSRGKMASRGKLASRGKMASRGKISSRGKMASRGKMVGGHQE